MQKVPHREKRFPTPSPLDTGSWILRSGLIGLHQRYIYQALELLGSGVNSVLCEGGMCGNLELDEARLDESNVLCLLVDFEFSLPRELEGIQWIGLVHGFLILGMSNNETIGNEADLDTPLGTVADGCYVVESNL